MDVRDIIWKGIQDAGGTGLCQHGCGCEFPDLVPCCSDPCNCVPAVRKKCGADCDQCGGDGCMVPVANNPPHRIPNPAAGEEYGAGAGSGIHSTNETT